METCLGRQPVVDRSGRVLGYELFFRAADGGMPGVAAGAGRGPLDELAASAAVLSSLLCAYGQHGLSAEHLLFINVNLPMLADGDFIGLLPTANVVLDVHGSPEDIHHLEAHAARLRGSGIRIAIDDDALLTDTGAAWLGLVDFVKVDIQATDELVLYRMVLNLQKGGRRVVAKRVESTEDVQLCDEVSIGLFQGYRFGMPVTIREATLSPSFAVLTEALDLLGRQRPAEEIHAVLKRDPALLMRLLSYANSPALGATRRIDSLDQVILLLGYQQLYRWVALLLYTSNGDGLPAAMVESMLARSRFMELMGEAACRPRREQDHLFLAGLLSMAETALGLPVARLLEKVQPPAEVVTALTGAALPLGPFLLLARAVEQGDVTTISKAARYFGVPVSRINTLQLMALAWAEDMALSLG